MKPWNRLTTFVSVAALAGMLASAGSCTPSAALNLTAPTSTFSPPLGLATPRDLLIGFINNTPFRAVFTFGGYDPHDKETSPNGFGQLRLEGNSASGQFQQSCRKAFSVGGEELVRLIDVRDLAVNDPRALVDGVNFSGAPANDPLAAVATEGTALGRTLLAGVDYTCDDLLLFTFEQDATAPGGFRIDLSRIPR